MSGTGRVVLVTGAAGFIGSRIVEEYAARGWRVEAIAYARPPQPGDELPIGIWVINDLPADLDVTIAGAILAEAGLSILGLGPRTTEVPTLGLMMNWAMIYQAHILGKWWAYFPVIIVIALIAFSMNLMNTGLDQVFNPALRD